MAEMRDAAGKGEKLPPAQSIRRQLRPECALLRRPVHRNEPEAEPGQHFFHESPLGRARDLVPEGVEEVLEPI